MPRKSVSSQSFWDSLEVSDILKFLCNKCGCVAAFFEDSPIAKDILKTGKGIPLGYNPYCTCVCHILNSSTTTKLKVMKVNMNE
jgi:hypothetical protein